MNAAPPKLSCVSIYFGDLPIGARFEWARGQGMRLGGTFFKTGPRSYGTHPDEPSWDWDGQPENVEPLQ